jgi:hypothetical protein
MSAASPAVLYASPAPAGHLHAARAGVPVWPLAGEDDRRALEVLCGVLGARLQVVPGGAGSPAPAPPGAEEVAALGGPLPEAALYASLTGRRVRAVRDAAELADGPRPAVVVAPREAVGAELFDALYEGAGDGPASGIVCAPRAELRRQVLLRAAAAVLPARPAVRRLDYNALHPLGGNGGDGVHFGAHTPPAALRAVAGAGAGVLTVFTHSDGVDAYLGPGMVACRQAAPPAGVPAARAPSCAALGHCLRLGRPIAHALAEGAILGPEGFRCGVLVWGTCFGWIEPSDALDARWALLDGFLASPAVGAVVTVPGLYFGDLQTGGLPLPLTLELAAGVEAGAAVARANRLPEMVRYGQRFVLFGDPRTRLAPPPAGEAAGEAAAEAAEAAAPAWATRVTSLAWDEGERDPAASAPGAAGDAPGDAAEEASLDLAALLIDEQVAKFARGEGSAPNLEWNARWAGAAGEALLAYRAARREGADAVAAEALAERFSAVWADFLISCGRLAFNWLPFAEPGSLRLEERPCAGCGRRARGFVARLALPGAPPRRVTVCPRCQFVEDAPASSGVALALEDGRTLRLQGTLPAGAWQARLRLWAQDRRNGVTLPWPGAADGRPVRALALPAELPLAGVGVANLVLVRRAEFRVLAVRASLGGGAG